ncbi:MULTISPECIES: type VII secretion integral membrane protein EccD [Amycolatopsis]|uniref:Type VII secretion integral membrane protein EccD n=1 Tax=Amycolatopsis albidoflavus TaxID=102226 RepID=A0ABW5I844_9PSEU
MTSSVIDDLCRITVVAAKGRTDLSIPVQMTVSELLPTLLRHVDPAQDGGIDAWVLQRVGEEPLDPDGTADSLGLLDGDVLYLQMREAAMAPVHFDDLVDGVATAIRERPDRWRPAMTKHLYLGLAASALVIALFALLIAGPLLPRALGAGLLAVLAGVAGTVCSRSLGAPAAACVFGLAAAPFASFSGLLLPNLFQSSAAAAATVPGPFGWSVGPLSAANFLAAGALGALTATAVSIGVGIVRPAFVSVAAIGVGVVLGGTVDLVWSIGRVGASGLVAVTALVCTIFGPMNAARLVRLRLPLMPETIEQLQEDIDPLPGPQLMSRAKSADRYLNALSVAAGVLCSACAIILVPAEGWAPRTLGFLVGAAMLLRSRVLVSAWQRSSAVVPGAVAACALALTLAGGMPPWGRAGIALVLGAAAIALSFGSAYLPGRRLVPFWGRWAEISESLMALAAIPVLLQVLGVYSWARGLFG